MRSKCRIVMVALLSACAAGNCRGQTPPTPTRIEVAIADAKQNFESKQFKLADQKLKDAELEIKRYPLDNNRSREIQADLSIRRAQVFMHKDAKQEDLANSLAILKSVAESTELGSPQQRAVAQVNGAAVLMRLGRPAEAAQWMEKCEWDNIEPGQRHVLYYNYARTLEAAGEPAKAVVRYARSLAVAPSFAPALDRLTQLVRELSTAQPDQFNALCKSVIDEGAPQAASVLASEALLRQTEVTPQALDAIKLLLNAFAADYVNADKFQAEYGGLLNRLSDSRWKACFSEVRMVCSPEFDEACKRTEFAANSTAKLAALPWCTSYERRGALLAPMATFMQKVATSSMQVNARDQDAVDPDPNGSAFNRVYAAWILTPTNHDLGRQLASLTKTKKDDGIYRMARERLIESMISEKGEAYRLSGKTAEDWKNILLMHTILGSIFEDDKNCGDEQTLRSGIWHWRYAINAEKQIRQFEGMQDYRAPGIHEHLANCLAGKMRWPEAHASYLESARIYLSLGNVVAAERVVNAAMMLEDRAVGADKNELQRLMQEVERAKAARRAAS